MPISDMVIRSKVIPPQPQRVVFHRPRLQERLESSRSFPLTLIHGGAGFGKTTTLLELSSLYPRVYWYDITEPDRDPILFLAHLIAAFFPDSTDLLERLDSGGSMAAPAVFTAMLNQLTLDMSEEAVLVLDDYHLVSDVRDINRWFEQLVENHPPKLHIAIACRKIPDTPGFIRWRVKGNLLIIDQEDLSFNESEIARLFTDYYNFAVTAQQVQTMSAYTDGWIIALQMIWHRLQISRSRKLDNILAELPTALSDVFNFLAQEVLMRQPEPLQEFLVSSASLRQMEAGLCNYLLGFTNSADILEQLAERGLFVSSFDRVNYRYQRLFQDFLLDQLKNNPDRLHDLHLKAADYFITTADYEEAIYHFLEGGEKKLAAQWIETAGPDLLQSGRLRTLSKWIEQLEESDLEQHPRIWLLSGDALRLRSRFDDAISVYNRAEKVYIHQKDRLGRSQALRSKAQVYLDTIRPLKASSLLEEAVALLEPQEHPGEVAALLDQLSENKLNLGKPDDARALHNEANRLRAESDPDDIYLEGRALLRTGHLAEAVNLLEPYRLQSEYTPTSQRPQRFHREMPLLLSLIHLMQGNIEIGERYAREGIDIGRQLDSPFVEAVGLMRLGHAYQLYPHLPWRVKQCQKALEFYERSMELVKPFNVMRVQVEPLWGLCRYYGYEGNLNKARDLATQALEISETSGDYWFVALIQATLGTSYAISGQIEEAEESLNKAVEGFVNVGDVFGQSAARCASVFNHWQNGLQKEALDLYAALVPQLSNFNHGFLLTRPTHLGIQDPQIYNPLLINAVREGIEVEWTSRLLSEIGLSGMDYHPGYKLSIRTLGRFEVWRGKTLTSPRDWQREKARQLMQFFISNRGKWFSREQIADRLWPDLELDSTNQILKVALNALNRALEPNREPGQTPFFIIRHENMYGLNHAAEVRLDTDDFIALSNSTAIEDQQEALSIYTGDYLFENCAENWVTDTRQRMREVFLTTSQRLAETFFNLSRWEDAMRVSQELLAVDPCNEPAFHMLMRCQAARGNRSAVHAIYQRCTAILKDDLDVPPSRETTALWKELTK